MRSLRAVGPVMGALALALALSLLALPSPARAQEDDEWTNDGKDKEEGKVRIYRSQEAAPAVAGGYLGVQVQDVTRALRRARDLPTNEGALVNRVEDESPADEGGIRRGDVIVELDGKKIEDANDLIRAVRSLEPGEKATITLWRSGALRTVDVKVGNRPAEPPVVRLPGWGDDDEGRVRVPPPPRAPDMDRDRMGDRFQELQSQLERQSEMIARLQAEIRDLQRELRRMHREHARDNRGNEDDDEE